MKFGDLMGAGRREMGFSQEELAEIMDQNEADIALWEAGLEVPPDPTTVMELAAALKLEPDVLMAAVEDANLPDTDTKESDEPEPASKERSSAGFQGTDPDLAETPRLGDGTVEDPVAAGFGSQVVTRSTSRPSSSAGSSAGSSSGATSGSTGQAPSPGQVAVARAQMPAPAPSYLEDAKLVRLYRLRLIATSVVGVVLLFMFFWALGNFFDAVGVLWDSLRPGAG